MIQHQNLRDYGLAYESNGGDRQEFNCQYGRQNDPLPKSRTGFQPIFLGPETGRMPVLLLPGKRLSLPHSSQGPSKRVLQASGANQIMVWDLKLRRVR